MADGNRKIRDYRDLIVWQQSRRLVKTVYEATRHFPKEELFGLTQQVRRAAVSVPSNIAEGYGRGSRKEYIRFLYTARGSLYEVQTQLVLAEDLGYLSDEQVATITQEIGQCSRLLHGLIAALGKKDGALEPGGRS